MALTKEKTKFYKFKNKVDLSNRETFGYFSGENSVNNELFVYLNESFNIPEPKSITNFNIDGNINDIVKLFWDDKNNPNKINTFSEKSFFGDDQPSLTEYLEYKGNIFELFERLNQLTSFRISEEQKVKTKYIDLFHTNFLLNEGIKSVSKYMFNPSEYTEERNREVYKIADNYQVNKYKDYYNIITENKILTDMYLIPRSNSIRPSRIYYKKATTETGNNIYENKFIFPFYLKDTMDISLLVGKTIIKETNIEENTKKVYFNK